MTIPLTLVAKAEMFAAQDMLRAGGASPAPQLSGFALVVIVGLILLGTLCVALKLMRPGLPMRICLAGGLSTGTGFGLWATGHAAMAFAGALLITLVYLIDFLLRALRAAPGDPS